MEILFTPTEGSSCDREPIRTPGSIQPHGIMLVASIDSLLVTHVAGDVERVLGIEDWHGQGLDIMLGETLAANIASLRGPDAVDGFMGQLRTTAGALLDVNVHRSVPHLIIELEPANDVGVRAGQAMERVAIIAAGFEQSASPIDVCRRAAAEVRILTGFDRVMVYQFLDDGAGTVLAEDRHDDVHGFLNHHFPGSDIPQQARELYVRNLFRVIPDSFYQPAELRPAWTDPQPLDMSDASLRSVSLIHVRYLQNMGVRASASFSIVIGGILWGLVACHNMIPRRIPHDVRITCRALVGNLALQIKAKEEAEGYLQRIRLRACEDEIVAVLSEEGPLETVLSSHLDEVGRMMNGDGVAVLRGHELVSTGHCPAEHELRELAVWLIARSLVPVFASASLAKTYPEAERFQKFGSGLLAITLSADEPWLLCWFRAERLETVNWAGNPHKPAETDHAAPLTPRASFADWSETVSGRARPWSVAEVEAATRLRAVLLEVQHNRRTRELNQRLTRILLEKDLLLLQKELAIGEVNHRVQNSLGLVSSFLAMQSRASTDPGLHAALEEARRRLTAVALVHRRLYRGDTIDRIDAGHYVRELCADTFAFMGQDWMGHFTLDVDAVMIPADWAVTLGLVLTELLINANKYAYAGASGPIRVGLDRTPTHVSMVVADRGIGRSSHQMGFGSRIMDGLVKQLGGTLTETDNQPGLRVEISIPIQPVAAIPM
ncbi:GAF domain-containing protein [Lichenicola cladoniae]|uniref:GAF domain-containing protein n=1 Tax=Lichenicola cladoniae TaxID=1484109 RepID=A0A6M8HST9_9PROT|nr:histidine kinase dimerization/phosphoacceptor domain -containing protein [Lichenicola cladoniae]NPD65530.1 GAF domain-containing protein [Acetobacteraceae bacterium]QKE91418.1 GAF domain-containing protein [Lichenicola cladoniae]